MHHEVSVVTASMVISVHVTEPKSHVASSCSSIVRIALPSQRYSLTSRSQPTFTLTMVYGTASNTAARLLVCPLRNLEK